MQSVEDWMDASKVLAEVQHYAEQRMAAAADAVASAKAEGLSDDDAFNGAAEQLVSGASWRGYATMLEALCQSSEAAPDDVDCPPEIAAVLRSLAAIFGCHVVARHGGVDLPVAGGRYIPAALQRLCARLRPDAVALVDAFDYDDRVLNSTLGVKSGRVYEALYEASRRSTRDFQEPFQGYKASLQPLLDKEYLKRGAGLARSRL